MGITEEGSVSSFVFAQRLTRNCECFWVAPPDHDGAPPPLALELLGSCDANVSGRDMGLSMRFDQDLYQARLLKSAIPNTLTKICIQIALVTWTSTK